VTGSHLTEIREMIEAAAAKAGVKVVEHMDGAGHFDIGYIPDGDPVINIETGVATLTNVELIEVSVVHGCAWCCPVTCRNCEVKGCVDRIAGGEDEVSENMESH